MPILVLILIFWKLFLSFDQSLNNADRGQWLGEYKLPQLSVQAE